MAEHEVHPTQGPNIDEAFVADRQQFWSAFTTVTMYATIGLAALLVGMAVFLL